MQNSTLESQSSAVELVSEIFAALSLDLESMLEHSVRFGDLHTQLAHQRAQGDGQVHISFRFTLKSQAQVKMGCLLMPLPEANALAGYLLALGERATRVARRIQEPATTMKESMLLLGQIFSTSLGRVAMGRQPLGLQVSSAGCQGVRAGIRPALEYREGAALLVARAESQVGSFAPFETILMLPCLD